MRDRDFVAATWNTAGGTPTPPDADKLEPVLHRIEHHEASVILLQELSHPDVRTMLRDNGWRLHVHRPQYGIAWRADAWPTLHHADGVRLARTTFDRVGGSTATVEAARAVLADKHGRTITALSYHLPSHVQVANKPARRVAALREAMVQLRHERETAHSRACLFGGDDNVDERLAHGPWDFMLRRATGLRLVQAPGPTIGRVRRIDDFRVRGLEPGHGLTIAGGGDHKVHVRVFRWL